MANDNHAPFENLDLDSLYNARKWMSEAVEAKGATIVGTGVGVKGALGMAALDIEIDGYRFNLEITPRQR